MNAVLIKRTLRDYRLLAAGTAVLLLGFVVLFMFAISSMPLDENRFWLDLPWVRRLMSAMIGADISEMVTRTGFTSFVFTHPLMWIMVIGFLLTLTSGVLSGEIDRGTMDLLATLPISRTRLYASLSVAALLLGLPTCGTVWLGAWLGRSLLGWRDVRLDALALLAFHLYAVYIFIACFAIAVSAACSRRTTALVICFVFVFYAFVLNLLVAFWPAAQKIAFTGFLHYYAPLPIVRDQALRWGDVGVLLGAAAIFWTTGLAVFRRRDLPAT